MDNSEEKDLMRESDIVEEEEEEEIEEQGFFDRIVNVFVDPTSLFKYLAIKPDFWTPWVVVGLVLAVMTAVAFPTIYELQGTAQVAAMREQGLDEGEITEKMEKYHSPAAKTTSLAISIAAVVIMIPVGWLIGGAILFLISLVQGLETSFKRVFSVVAYSSIIGMLGAQIIDKVIKLAQGNVQLAEWNISKVSLAGFLPEGTHRAIQTASATIDPFAIWSLIVIAIGLTFANRCRMKSAVVTVVIYFIVTLIFMIGMGFLMQAFMPGGGEGGNVRVQVN
jgi:hypothetical protein